MTNQFRSVLKAHDFGTYVIGAPSVEPASAPWRFDFIFSRYTLPARWFDFVFDHDWLNRFGALRLIDSQSILDPTNQTTITSPWLNR